MLVNLKEAWYITQRHIRHRSSFTKAYISIVVSVSMMTAIKKKKKFAFISSGALEHETLEKPCHHGPKNRSTNSEYTYIDRLRGVEVCIVIH